MTEHDNQSALPLPDIEEVLQDPSASRWLLQALSSALLRDPVDAVNDAELLAKLLERRCNSLLHGS